MNVKLPVVDTTKYYNEIENPSLALTDNVILADIVLTSESMNAFGRASVYLLDEKYSKSIREKNLQMKDLPVKSRVLAEWGKNDVISLIRASPEHQPTFSKIDLAYIHILKSCRDFGLSLRKLQMARDSLFFPVDTIGKCCLLEIAYAYFDKNPTGELVYLIVDRQGRCNIIRQNDFEMLLDFRTINKHFVLNLNEVWNEI